MKESRLQAATLAFAIASVPILTAGMWNMHATAKAQEARVAVTELRMARMEKALSKLDEIQSGVADIRAALGIETAIRRTLHQPSGGPGRQER